MVSEDSAENPLAQNDLGIQCVLLKRKLTQLVSSIASPTQLTTKRAKLKMVFEQFHVIFLKALGGGGGGKFARGHF